MSYLDVNGVKRPIRYATVRIYDEVSSTQNRLLKETYTDTNGRYDVSLSNDEADGMDLFVRVYTEGKSGAYPGTTSSICTVKAEMTNGELYLESSTHYNNTSSDLVVNLTEGNTGNAGAFSVFDSIVEAFIKTRLYFS